MARTADAKFEGNQFGNVFAVMWVLHMATLILLPNWLDCRFSGNQAPITHLQQLSWLPNLLFQASLGLTCIIHASTLFIDTLKNSEITEWPTRQGGPLPDPI